MPNPIPSLNDKRVICHYLQNLPLHGYVLNQSLELESCPRIEKASFISTTHLSLETLTKSPYCTDDSFSNCLDKFSLAELGINSLTMELEE